jgi:hypothetical protein
VNERDPLADLRAQFRPTMPGARNTVFIESHLGSSDATITNYAQAIAALPPETARRAARALLHTFGAALQEAGAALASWDTDDNPKLMGQMLLACGQANAALFEVQTALQISPIAALAEQDSTRRSRRMSAIMVGPRLLGLVLAFVRLFEHAGTTSLFAKLLGEAAPHLWGPYSTVAGVLKALRRELDDAAISPIELHQLKAGAADANNNLVTMFVGAIDAGESAR